jgi:hypothetical protein
MAPVTILCAEWYRFFRADVWSLLGSMVSRSSLKKIEGMRACLGGLG